MIAAFAAAQVVDLLTWGRKHWPDMDPSANGLNRWINELRVCLTADRT